MTNQRTILVVDDDPSTLLICRKTLERNGFRVLQAAGSSEALKIFVEKSGFIDLLLTDLLLPPPDFQLSTASNRFPRVHGHEVIARVLDIKRSFRIVCMSAATMGELIHHGMQLGRLPFLQKPFTADQLLQAIRDALTGQPIVRRNPVSVPGQKDVPWYD
jgi:DNA-binding NtrC family response regulator